ncbi:phenylalanine 4-monooxygenase [Aestuariibius sp. 2305UL40-4]|uniref:phenylalanine 4-monooxygenase n=1 Tax=Aestuariibius violaceus TaxID=3234132 RepID=UPI00345EDD21
MSKTSGYASKEADANGVYTYDDADRAVWKTLFERQMTALDGKAAPEFLARVKVLGLNAEEVPQIKAVDARLRELSGAGVEGVPAIIPPSQFFELLSRRRFPVATFLRRREHLDYIEEPDLFHEVFGHCPLLTDPDYAAFIEGFGKKAVALDKSYRWHLFRLFWFTVEFGMMETQDGLRAYGAGIVSSPAEAKHACGGAAEILPFDLMTVLRTPYRIDIVQPVYFKIKDFAELRACLDADFAALIAEAKRLGDLPARFDEAA